MKSTDLPNTPNGPQSLKYMTCNTSIVWSGDARLFK